MLRGCAVGVVVAVLIAGCSLKREHGIRHASGEKRYDEMVVLIPKAGGQAGAVVVRYQGKEVLINRPYQSARVRNSGALETGMLSRQEVQREFAGTLAALPPRPKTYTVYFVEGKDDLTDASVAQFEAILSEAIRSELAARPAPEVSIVGHTDSVGSERFNDQLSMARAQRVKDELVKRGIPAGRIVGVYGRGMRDPVVVTGPSVAEPRNRRVEISVR